MPIWRISPVLQAVHGRLRPQPPPGGHSLAGLRDGLHPPFLCEQPGPSVSHPGRHQLQPRTITHPETPVTTGVGRLATSANLMTEIGKGTLALIVAWENTKPWHRPSPGRLRSPCPSWNARKPWPMCSPTARTMPPQLPWSWVRGLLNCISLLPLFFIIIGTLFNCSISRQWLTGGNAVQLQWHLTNTNVTERILPLLSQQIWNISKWQNYEWYLSYLRIRTPMKHIVIITWMVHQFGVATLFCYSNVAIIIFHVNRE